MQDADWDSIVDGHARELYLGVVQKLKAGVAAQQDWLKSAERAFLGARGIAPDAKWPLTRWVHQSSAQHIVACGVLHNALFPPRSLAADRAGRSCLPCTLPGSSLPEL